MPAKKRVKPCDMVCEKCGSKDVVRKFLKKGKVYDIFDNYDRQEDRENEFVKIEYRSENAKQDCISHFCRTCSYRWESFPWLADFKLVNVRLK